MKLTVKNLGPIEEVTVDLSKDLIVLTGQNNTGKTYLTNLICGLSGLGNKSDIDGVLKKFSSKSFSSLNNFLQNKLQDVISSILTDELSNIFASNHPYVKNGSASVLFEEVDIETIEKHIPKSHTSGKIKPIDYSASIITFLRIYFLPSIKYFSSERQGINLFHRDLTLINSKVFNELLKSKNPIELQNFLVNRINRFPVGIKKNIDLINAIENKKNFFISQYKDLVEELESILNGKVSIDENGEIFQMIKNKEGKKLPIQLSSSSFKSLSLLSLYLKHLAEKGDTIIIDEPELNLHPDNQRKVARFLGRLVNEGFKVIISTHSDYIIKELNNMIMLSSANGNQEELLKSLGYNKNQLLKNSQVEAHLFTLAKSKPEKIEIDETGFSVTTIDEVIEQLDNDTEKIYYELFEKAKIA